MTMEPPGVGPLDGRRALVTGAGIGIGRGVALGLAAAGAQVVFHGHEHAQEAAEAAATVNTNGRTWALRADLASVDEVRSLVERAADLLGGLDILINNAGITIIKDLGSMDLDAYDRLFAVNVRAAYVAIQSALPFLERSDHAAIVNTTSGHGAAGFPGFSAYAASKGAIIALTRQLAIELAPRRIRVNAVGPGIVEGPRYQELDGYDPELGKRLVPIGRSGLPEDVAGAVVYLVSDAASFVTGQVLFVDGGTDARMGVFWPGLERGSSRD